MVVQVKTFVKFVAFAIFDFFVRLFTSRRTDKQFSLGIIKLDAIGDFIILQTILPYVFQKLKEEKIIFIGNSLWKDLFLKFNESHEIEGYFINPSRFSKNFRYRYTVIRELRSFSIQKLINPTYSRNALIDDTLIHSVIASNKIGYRANSENSTNLIVSITNRFYNNLVDSSHDAIFEFERQKVFFKSILGEEPDHTKLKWKADESLVKYGIGNNYVIIVPGAGQEMRRWEVGKFISVIDYLLSSSNLTAVILGSKEESYLGEIIEGKVKARVINLVGKTSLEGYIQLISRSSFFVSNETSAVHIAAIYDIPGICISNGNNLGRFNPYPDETGITTIYPPIIMDELEINREKVINKYYRGSNLDINEINERNIIEIIDGKYKNLLKNE